MKTSDTLPYSSLTPYCLASLRILAIAFAIMFIPACAVPLGVNDAMIGIICSLIASIVWNFFTVLYEGCSATALPCTLMLLVDIMILPSTVITFATMCMTGEIGDGSTPYDTHNRRVSAFGLLLAIGITHVVCFLLWSLIVLRFEARHKSRLSKRPRPLMTRVSSRRDAYRKQRALPPTPRRQQSNASMLQAVDVLPLYTPGEIGRPPPAYKSVDDTEVEQV